MGAVQDLSKALRQDRKGDFRFTGNQLDAIFKNLTTTGKGVGSQLSGEQARILGAMQRLGQRTNARQAAIVGGNQKATVNRYGTALGKVVDNAFQPARAAQSATATEVLGLKRSGALTAKGGTTAVQAQQAAAKEAGAGADYALASALSYRAKNDATLVAQQRSAQQQAAQAQQYQLEQMKLQSQLDQENAAYQAKLQTQTTAATAAADPASAAALAQVTGAAAPAAQWMAQYIASNPSVPNADGSTSPITPGAATQAYIASQGFDPSDPRALLAQQIASNIIGAKMGPTMAAQQAFTQTGYSSMPGYNATTVNSTIAAGVASQNTAAIQTLQGQDSLTAEEQAYLNQLLASRGGTPATGPTSGSSAASSPGGYASAMNSFYNGFSNPGVPQGGSFWDKLALLGGDVARYLPQ